MLFHLADARAVADASALLDMFGTAASAQAAVRARDARHIGNHIRFCHWRQVERLIALLDSDEAVGTIH